MVPQGKRIEVAPEDRAELERIVAGADLGAADGGAGADCLVRRGGFLGGADRRADSQAHAILAAASLEPHLAEQWLMTDFCQPDFDERAAEICGLYLNPPENLLVVSIDEKTGVQAKAPTRPDTPPAAGRPARREYEYVTAPRTCSPA